MRRGLELLLIIIFLTPCLYASTVIKGTVANIKNGQPLMGAHVYLQEKNLVAITNANGEYIFENIQYGTYHLKVTYIGFYDVEKKLKISNQKEVNLNFVLFPEYLDLDSTVIIASRTKRAIDAVPASVNIISNNEIRDYPAITMDDILNTIPGIYINRNQGIYSKSASVAIRGLSSSSRVLVLLDGVPINKADKGFINWNRINPQEVERIEVIKGPTSAVYGGNAMAGVINIITKDPDKNFGGEASIEYGTYKTISAHLNLYGRNIKDHKGFYWYLNGGTTVSEGYNFMPVDIRDSTDIVAGMSQFVSGIKLGYQLNKNHKLEINFDHYTDKIDDGRKIYEEESGFNMYPTDFVSFNYSGRINRSNYELNMYYQLENYLTQKESLKSTGAYQLLSSNAYRNDIGMLFNFTHTAGPYQRITAGFDYRKGLVDAQDIYKTSTDIILNKGQMDVVSFFLQDEINLYNNKILLIGGLRLDHALFHKGEFSVNEPTAITDFMEDYVGTIGSGNWTSISPRLALHFKMNNKIKTYLSFGKGFRPPILDDLCRNGSISKGFKLANPDLQPEILYNYEVGSTYFLHEDIEFKSSLFYSNGVDFQYFVGTGDSMYTGGGKLKPVLKRDNIGDVEIYGYELEVNWKLWKTIYLKGFYNKYFSEIKNYRSSLDTDKSLIGKNLNEFPDYQYYIGVEWQYKSWFLHLDFKYTGAQWYDEENTSKVEAYDLWNLKLSKAFNKHWNLSVTVNDLLDKGYVDRKGLQSPGRFILSNISYKF